jgi:hypothetical protein
MANHERDFDPPRIILAKEATVSTVTDDLTNPKLGAELLRNAKDALPLDVWRLYVWQHVHHRANCCPSSVIEWCDNPPRSTLDPQTAVDDAWKLLAGLLFTTPPLSYDELAKGVWEAQTLLFSARSEGRKRGQPSSIRQEAVRAYVIRKFNPHPKKPGESTVGWARLADLLFLEDGKCPRMTHDHDLGTEHRYDDPCVKALMTAVGNLKKAMKDDGIPT